MAQFNWFGREIHPSDNLIHWSDQSNIKRGWPRLLGTLTFNSFEAFVDQLRADWELVNSNSEVKAAFERLLDAKGHVDSMDEGERAAGEDL